MPKQSNDGSAKLRSKKQEAFARAVALEDKGLSEAYRASRDCSRMTAKTVNANAKREAKLTPVRLRIEWLKAHGLPKQDGPGRPTTFRQEFCAQATHLCILGATDADLCEFFGCAASTLNLWKQEHPEFSEALKAGKIVTDMDVAVSLNKRARGYDYEEEQPIKLREVHYDKDGKKTKETERVEMAKVRRIQPPDTGAAIFWLTNRRKEQWKQRSTNALTGANDGPVEVGFRSLDPKRMSDDELESFIVEGAESVLKNGDARH